MSRPSPVPWAFRGVPALQCGGLGGAEGRGRHIWGRGWGEGDLSRAASRMASDWVGNRNITCGGGFGQRMAKKGGEGR